MDRLTLFGWVGLVSLASSALVYVLAIVVLSGGFPEMLSLSEFGWTLGVVHLVFALGWVHAHAQSYASQTRGMRYRHALAWGWLLILSFLPLALLWSGLLDLVGLVASLLVVVIHLWPIWLTVPFLTLELYRLLYLHLVRPGSARAAR